MAAALPQLRRHRPPARDLGAGVLPRQRLVPRPPGLDRRPRLLRRPARPGRPAGDRLRRRAPAGRRHGRDLGRGPLGDTGGRPLRRPDHRRAAARRHLAAARPRARGLGRRRGPGRRPDAPGAVRRAARRPPGEPAPGRDLDLSVRPHAGRLRPEPRRLAAVHRPRRGRPRDHPPARRGPRGRRAGRPSAAHRAGDRPARAERRRRLLRADQDLPRVPLRRGHRVAHRAHAGLDRSGRRALRPAADRALRVLRRRAQPAAQQRGLGAARQLPRRPHRLSAARRAARLDRRPRGLRAVGGVPLRRARVPARLARGPRDRAARPGRAGALRRARRPEVHGAPDGVPGPRLGRDLERRGGVGAVGAVAGVRRALGARGPVRLDGRPRTPRRVASSRPAGCGTPGSSSATGWTRRRTPTGRSRPRRTTAWWPPRASTAAP